VGLGLTIVRSIVAAHAGSIEAVANAEGGLTVTVRLPPAR
jgi:K+-sensing histidine kinase KdpD